MQNSKARSSVSPEMAQKSTLSSPRSMQTSSKPSFSEKRMVRGSEMQPQLHQLQEELRRAIDERTRALEDLEELRSNKRMSALSNKEEMVILEKKVEKRKESERKMLESLVFQTKQLEQTKILLEEAKLEAKSLRDNLTSLENGGERERTTLDLIQDLRNELKLATEAEGKSKKAMDDLAMALKEVTAESNQVKATLSTTQSELEKEKLDAEQWKDLVKITNEKLRSTIEESEVLKLESEEMVAKVKASENETAKLKLENDKLIESLRGSREETSNLRDIMKQALNEASVVKEALEITRSENSKLNNSLSEKEDALQCARQDYECLKISEAAATDSVKELKGFLDATSGIDFAGKGINGASESKRVAKFPSEQIPNGRRNSLGGSTDHENRSFGSLSNVSESRVPSFLYTESNRFEYESGSPRKQKKKSSMLKRFGELLRRKSIQK